jgi:hypothetical protein
MLVRYSNDHILPASTLSTSSFAVPSEDNGGSTGYTAPGDRELGRFGCCQKDWGRARSFIGRGSVREPHAHSVRVPQKYTFKVQVSQQNLTWEFRFLTNKEGETDGVTV